MFYRLHTYLAVEAPQKMQTLEKNFSRFCSTHSHSGTYVREVLNLFMLHNGKAKTTL